jgi:hypothetical protein
VIKKPHGQGDHSPRWVAQPEKINNNNKVKGKSIPLQALTDPEGSRRMRLPDFKTIGT